MIRLAAHRKNPDGHIANLEQGEYSVFVSQNPNIDLGSRRKIESEHFTKILQCIFIESRVDRTHYGICSVTSLISEQMLFANQGYICISDATEEDAGVVFPSKTAKLTLMMNDSSDKPASLTLEKGVEMITSETVFLPSSQLFEGSEIMQKFKKARNVLNIKTPVGTVQIRNRLLNECHLCVLREMIQVGQITNLPNGSLLIEFDELNILENCHEVKNVIRPMLKEIADVSFYIGAEQIRSVKIISHCVIGQDGFHSVEISKDFLDLNWINLPNRVARSNVGYELKAIGSANGDKHLDGRIPNMKIGEMRFYPQDNPNLYREKSRELTPKTLARILHSLFPGYEVETNEMDGSLVDNIVKRDTGQYVLNKAYICIKEATPESPGTIINLHNGYVLVFKERFVLSEA